MKRKDYCIGLRMDAIHNALAAEEHYRSFNQFKRMGKVANAKGKFTEQSKSDGTKKSHLGVQQRFSRNASTLKQYNQREKPLHIYTFI